MDFKEIYKNLTCGVQFKKRKIEKKECDKKVNTEKAKENLNAVNNDSDSEFDKTLNSNEEKFEDSVVESSFKFLKESDSEEDGCSKTKKVKKTKLLPEQKLFLKETEELNLLKKANKISVKGKQIPKPIQCFGVLHDEYQVPHQIVDNLIGCGFVTPTPVQMQVIPIMLKGQSVMASAPTGSGKTAAFLIPIIRDLQCHKQVGFRAIILCPTRELAKQTYRESLRLTDKMGIKIHLISKIKNLEEQYDCNAVTKYYDILISTPNRVRFLLQHEPALLDLKKIEWFIIDEADKLLENGKDNFKEQLDDIWNACPGNKKVGLFSATYTGLIAKWALKNIKNLIRVIIGERNSATNTVEQELFFVGNEAGKLLAIREMIRTGLKPPILIFVQSKDRAKQLFNELIYDGINIDVIHADRSEQQRDNVVKSFREGKTWVLICSELMSRGIDFKGVNLVINYDFPPSPISYIHRVGRTGRAGRRGKAVTFFTQEDQPNLRSIIHIVKNSGGKLPEFMLNLHKSKKIKRNKMKDYAPQREDIITTPKFVLEKRKQIKENLDKNKPEKSLNKKHQSYKAKLSDGVGETQRKNYVLINKKKQKCTNTNS